MQTNSLMTDRPADYSIRLRVQIRQMDLHARRTGKRLEFVANRHDFLDRPLELISRYWRQHHTCLNGFSH